MSQLPPALPPETTEAYLRYLSLPVAGKSILQNKVQHYLEEISNASGENEFLDSTLAKTLAHSLQALIDHACDQDLGHVQAAVYYFVESEDANPDLESIIGFDDDCEVFNAVCEHLGFPQLKVQL